MNMISKGLLATTLAASALVSTAPAQARDYYRRHNDNTAAVAIGAGIIGLALGAVVASSNNDRRNDGRYYDRRYRNDGRYDRNVRYYDQSQYDNGSRYYNSDRDWQRRGENYDSRYYGRRGY
jgi:hypothetical protein